MPPITCCSPPQGAPARAALTRPVRWKSHLRGWLRPAAAESTTPRAGATGGLKQLVYRSRGTGLMSQDTLASLLIASRAKNRAHDVTGLLIHCHSQYLQCLEGPAAAVDALFRVIEGDIRHDRVVVLQECAIERRAFAGWHMACTRVGDSAWLRMSTAAWQGQLAGRAEASPGFAFMQKAWSAAGDGSWNEALQVLG